jgi:tRNA modification GTPase
MSKPIVAIVGRPNVGKSTLLNLLAGEEKAIVTDIAGTTRDVLEENLVLKGISLRILKTADTVEKIGVDRALEHAKDADLILYVVDASVPLDENDAKIMEILKGRKAIVLLNKSDLTAVIEKEEMEQKTGAPVISISAREETGMEELEEQMKKMFFQGEISFNDEVYITNARHKQALLEAKKSLELTAGSIEMGMPEDFFSIDLMNAYEELGSIIGEAVGEDLVNEIFSKFCTGK